MLTFDPCLFSFETQDVRIAGQALSGGRSLSDVEDVIRTDGGGFVVADFAEGSTMTRSETLAWRALTAAMDGGATPVLVFFRDRYHQPAGASERALHSDGTPHSDGAPYSGGGAASAKVIQAAALRSTSLTIVVDAPLPLLGGEWLSIEHGEWGWRAYQIVEVSSEAGIATVTIRPPLREAVSQGARVELAEPRCVMRLASGTSNAVKFGLYSDPGISFVEASKPA